MKTTTFFLSVLTFLIGSNIFSQNCNDEIHTGEGTFYDGVAGSEAGNCSLLVAVGDYMHCAMNAIDYNNSSPCDACIEVSGAKGSTILKVVDQCPECAEGDVDMTMQAFAKIANVIDGRVPISWKFVPCKLNEGNSGVFVHFKEGSSQFFTAIQFRNITHAISSAEYQLPDGSWKLMERKVYNFFVEPSGISSPMALRVTSILGEQLVFEGVTLDLNVGHNTQLQFETPEDCEETLSINEFKTTSQSLVYPNPTHGILHISGTNTSWTLINTNGKILKQGNSTQLNLSSYANGLYFISIDGGQIIKIVKK